VGISKPGEMNILEEIFSPKLGVLTHIGSAHISNFKNEQQLIDEKIALFKDSELLIFNGDHPKVFCSIFRNNIGYPRYRSRFFCGYNYGYSFFYN